MGENTSLASRLRHRITLQRPLLTAGEGGHYSIAWQNVAVVWAEVTPLENRGLTLEYMFAEQLVGRASHAIVMRWRTDVSTEMRVSYAGRHFNIRSVTNENERGETLRLLVEENVAV